VNSGAELCLQGDMVNSVAIAIGNTGDWCWVDAEVGEGREVDSESDSEI
jgi:hypothetical protein